MPVENVSTIKQLVEFYPASTDPVLEGDDHLRLIKSVLKSCFPNIDGAVSPSHTEINSAVAYANGLNTYSKTLLAQVDAASWRNALVLGSAALYNHEYFAPMMHGHIVDDVIGAVPAGRAVTAQNGVGIKRPGEAAWSTVLDLTGDLEVGLRASGAAAGTYGSTSKIPRVTVDSFGRVTSVSEVNVPVSGGTTYNPPTTPLAVGTYTVVSGEPQPANAINGNTLTVTATTLGLPANSTWRIMGSFVTYQGTGNGGAVFDTPVQTRHRLLLRLT